MFDDSSADVKVLYELSVERKGVLILPDFVFFHDGNTEDSTIPRGQFFRVGLGRKNFQECLNLFGEVLCEGLGLIAH